MTCFNPKYAQISWGTKKDDENKGQIRISFETRENFYKLKEKFGHIHDATKPELIAIPCRKCIGCKIDSASSWATRCWYESQQWKNNCFITLTYDNEHLKSRSLEKKDIQDFLKRLRDSTTGIEARKYKGKIEYPIRYFYSGEYGPKNLRPHFHIGLFNYMPNDLQLWKLSHKGQPMFLSNFIAKKWGKGFITVQAMNYETATYIARYTIKKMFGSKIDYKNEGLKEEFIETSRRGGIGYQILENAKEYAKMKRNYGIWIHKKSGTQLKKIPQFIRNKWKNIDIEEMREQEEDFYYTVTYQRRKEADIATTEIMKQTDVTPTEYLQIQKRSLIEKIKKRKSHKRDAINEEELLPIKDMPTKTKTTGL